MRRLIIADLNRILRKPGLYIIVAIMLAVVLLRKPSDTAADQIDFYKVFYNMIGLTLVCMPVFLSVYGDELKSGAMITAIGQGLERKKVVLAKLIDSSVLLLGSYITLFIGAFIKNSISGIAVSPRQNFFLFLFCMFCLIRAIGVMALSSLVLFLTLSASGGMLVLILSGVAASPLLQAVQKKVDLPVYDYSYMGLLDSSFADFQAGQFGWKLILALIYLAIVIILNIKTFDRKELNL